MSIACLWFPDFYAAIEQRDAPEYAQRPLIVGGDPAKGATVVSASREARAHGIELGLEVARAQEQCPALIRRATDLRRYRKVADEIRALVREANERTEPIGLDGWYADWGTQPGAERQTQELAERIRTLQRLPLVAGIGPTRFVAYLAARSLLGGAGAAAVGAQGERVRTVAPEDVASFVGAHPVTELPNLGPSAASKLAQHGVRTIDELRALGKPALEGIVGPRNALTFWALAGGGERTRIAPQAQLKSLSRERTLRPAEQDRRVLGEALAGLAGDLEELLERERCEARGVRLDLLYEDGDRATRSATPPVALARREEIADVAQDLLERSHAGPRPVRRLRLQLVRLAARATPVPRQLRLF